MNPEKERALRHDRPTTALDPKLPKKTDRGLVILDNPDDGEIYDTGDASDFAGEKRRSAKQSADRETSTPRHS